MGKIKGYNIHFLINDKKFKGTTENTFKITPTVEESIVKEDAGKTQYEVTGYKSEFTINSIMSLKETGEATTHLDITDIRAAVIAGTVFPFVYGGLVVDDPIVSGSFIISDYSESTNSTENGTVSISCKVVDDTLTMGVKA